MLLRTRKAVIQSPRKHTMAAVYAARFVGGRPLDGQRRTDARWRHHGTRAVTDTGHASRWAHYSHARRSGIRNLIIIATAFTVYGLIVGTAATIDTIRVCVWIALLIAAWWIVEKSRRYAHRKEIVAPLAETLAQKLGDTRYALDPRTWIHIPVDVEERPSRIYLPLTFSPTDQQEKTLARLVARRIGLTSPSAHFELRGERPYMELTPAPAPRDLVTFADPAIRALVAMAPDGRPVLGLAPRDTPYGLDLDADAPHVGFSMATNAGKSVAARALIMQILHGGGLVLILDRKQVSQAWCKGLPNVRYAASPQEIHEALLWLSGEIDERFGTISAHADIRGNVDPALVGPRLAVVAEELNTLEQDLAAYWRSIKETGDPAKPPSLAALGRAMAMGRQGRVHVIPIGQKLTAQAIGGTAARENMSTRVLGRATVSTWNMLAPECKIGGRYPKRSMHRGRVHVVADGEATPVQVMLTDEEDARAYAMSGTVSTFPRTDEAGPVRYPSERADHTETRDAASLPPYLMLLPALEGEIVEEGVTLADAAGELGLAVKTLRNARDRDPAFPDPVERPVPGQPARYRMADLEKWAANRPSVVREKDRP